MKSPNKIKTIGTIVAMIISLSVILSTTSTFFIIVNGILLTLYSYALLCLITKLSTPYELIRTSYYSLARNTLKKECVLDHYTFNFKTCKKEHVSSSWLNYGNLAETIKERQVNSIIYLDTTQLKRNSVLIGSLDLFPKLNDYYYFEIIAEDVIDKISVDSDGDAFITKADLLSTLNNYYRKQTIDEILETL